MGQKDKSVGGMDLSRRDFLKVSAAGAAAATTVAATIGFDPAPAMAQVTFHGGDTALDKFHTTCPYCSASCGQIISVGNVSKDVYDVYGDVDSPINNGGLCAKGAGAYQLVTNARRLGAFAGAHPVNALFEYDPAFDSTGVAYKRLGNGPWSKMALTTALDEIATGLVTARESITPGVAATSNSRHVQFYGSSHMNNEQNYTYRKLIAEFGTSQTEHQARI